MAIEKLITFETKEALQLAKILEKEQERGITITAAHPKPFIMDSLPLLNKSPDTYWRKGKLRTKKKKK